MNVSNPAARWTAVAPCLPASRTPFQDGAGAGGRQRRSPTGGAAKGMPLNTATVPLAFHRPASRPCPISTSGFVRRAMSSSPAGIPAPASRRA